MKDGRLLEHVLQLKCYFSFSTSKFHLKMNATCGYFLIVCDIYKQYLSENCFTTLFFFHTRIWNFQTFVERITAASNFTFQRNVMWVIRMMTQNWSVGKLWGIKVCLTDVWLCSSNTITSHLLCFRSEWASPLAQLSYLNRKTVRLLLHFTLVAKLNISQE